MADEILKISVQADTKDAINGLNATAQAAQNLGTAFQNTPQITNQASLALNNLSRIAQDAPYGFIGISNNLNPMLESFQRLQTSAGNSGNALKAMVSALSGPAGLGLAVGVASSLIVKFGDDISAAFQQMFAGSRELQQTTAAINGAKDAFAKAYTEMQNLGNAFEQFHAGTMDKKSVLEQYNNTLGKVYGNTKDIAEAERLYIADKDAYVQSALYKAAAQVALQKAAEQAFKAQEALMNPKQFFGADLGQSALAGIATKLTGKEIFAPSELLAAGQASKTAQGFENMYKDIAKSFESMVVATNASADKSKLFGKDKTEKDYALADEIAQLERAIQLNERYANEWMAAYEKRHQFFTKQWDIERPERQQTDITKLKLDNEAPMWAREDVASGLRTTAENQALFNQQLKETQEIVGYVSPLFESFTAALVMGDDVGKALEQTFKRIVIQLISMVAQMLLFRAILAAFTGGGSEFGSAAAEAAGGGGFGGVMGEFLLRGSDLVLATQRANYSLDNRR